MSEFPPVDIVNMKMSIFSMVGAKELEILSRPNTFYTFLPIDTGNISVEQAGESDKQVVESEKEAGESDKSALDLIEETIEEQEDCVLRSGIHRGIFKNP